MATRSRIGIELPTGEVKSVYCHWDGCPSRIIPLLLTHYSERTKVEQLIELGSICSLRSRLAPNEGEIHTMESDIKDVTLSYARDMGQSDFVTTNISKDREEFRIGDIEEWGYLFILDNEWVYAEGKYPENSPFMKAMDFKEDVILEADKYKNMSNISVKTQGVKGAAPKYQEKVGYVTTFLRHSEDYISVDDFEGYGNSYKQRELTNITIVQNGVTLFEGSKYELFEILNNAK